MKVLLLLRGDLQNNYCGYVVANSEATIVANSEATIVAQNEGPFTSKGWSAEQLLWLTSIKGINIVLFLLCQKICLKITEYV